MYHLAIAAGVGALATYAALTALFLMATATCTDTQRRAVRDGLWCVLASLTSIGAIVALRYNYELNADSTNGNLIMALVPVSLAIIFGYRFYKACRAAKTEAAVNKLCPTKTPDRSNP